MLINDSIRNSYVSYGAKQTASHSLEKTSQKNFSQTNFQKVFPPLLMEINGKKSIVAMTSDKGSVNVVRDDTYTDDNPIMLVKGMDSHGNEYEEKINPKKVNPKNANSVEMAALTAYMISTGKIEEKSGISTFVYPHANYSSQSDVFDKIDFTEDIKQFASWQKDRDSHDQYVYYTDTLMKMMDFVSESRRTASVKETQSKQESKTEIITNPDGDIVMQITTPSGILCLKIGETQSFVSDNSSEQMSSEETLNIIGEVL